MLWEGFVIWCEVIGRRQQTKVMEVEKKIINYQKVMEEKRIIYWRERYIKEENWIGKTGFQILWFQRRGKNNDWTSSAVKESFLLTRKSLRAVPSFCVWIFWYRLVMRSEHPLDVWRPAILKYWKWTVFCGERVHYRYFTRFDLMHISYYWVTEAGSGGT